MSDLTLHINGQPVTLENMARKAGSVTFKLGDVAYVFHAQRLPDGAWLLERDLSDGMTQRMAGAVTKTGVDFRQIQLGAMEATISEPAKDHGAGEAAVALSPKAPMSGIVHKIHVKAGDRVAKGTPVAVMEAMKVQITLNAGGDGVVAEVIATAGAIAVEGSELVRITPLDAGKAA